MKDEEHEKLTPMDLVGQFILCKTKGTIPEGWEVRQNGAWYLGSHPSLPVMDILATDSSKIGWLLGWAVSPEGRLVDEAVGFSVSPRDADAPDMFESCLYEYGGRFAAVCLVNQTSRFYLDPIGSLAAVYSEDQEMAASTPTLIPQLGGREDSRELLRASGVPQRTLWGPFGVTSRLSVERLMPDHFLDLAACQPVRHWPRGEVDPVSDVDAALGEISALLKRNIRAVADRFPLHMGLTAGRDSRMLLACAREHVPHIAFFTYTVPDAGKNDRQVAPKIARHLGLNHVFVPREEPSQAEQAEWIWKTGGCSRGVLFLPIRVCRKLDPKRALLLGAAGEVGRGMHWRRGDTESTPIAVDDLLVQRRVPVTSEMRQRAEHWLSNLHVQNSLLIWGVAYNELVNGCLMAPQYYGHTSLSLIFCPFSNRRILEIMLGLPTEYRRQLCLPVDLVEHQWPELLRWPFNWPMGIRRLVFAVTRRAELLCKRLPFLSRKEGVRQ